MVELDVLVIGGGTAGSYAAEMARNSQASVGLAERDKVGGDCVFHACIPTKALVQAARAYKKSRTQDFFGLPALGETVDYSRVKSFKDNIIRELAKGQEEGLTRQGIQLFKGSARFTSAGEMAVGEHSIRAKQIIIATGSRPMAPPIPGLEQAGYITNVEALELESVPRRLAIIGGGPVGCEFAQIFSAFGSRVTIFEASPRILANEDGELSDTAARLFGAQGIAVSAGVKIEEVRASHGAKVVSAREASGTEASTEFDEILVAVGRSPNVEDLDLGKAGVEYGKKGIRVDSAMRTSVPGIWAAGDVTETLQFTYVAWEQGEAAGWNATSKDARKVDYSILPRVTYCDPEVASVGMTEARSRDKGLQVKVGRWEYSSLPRAMVSGETEGLIKVIAEAGSGRILGGHIIGAQASILIHEIAAAMRGGITAEQIGKTVHAYPTFSEGVRWACKEAA